MVQVETVQIKFKNRKIITYSTDYQEGNDMISDKYITSISVDSLTDTKEVLFYGKVKTMHGYTTTIIDSYKIELNKNIKEIKVLEETL